MTPKLAAAFIFALALSSAQTVPVPTVTIVPTTSSSRAFYGSDNAMVPVVLSDFGYTEIEVLISGKANVYDWAADGNLNVKIPNVPYTNRILVRRPSNPSKFSGTVVVELMNPPRRFDWAMMWGYLHEYLMEHGDAWVGITMPASVAGLKKFDSTRYAALSFANPAPDEICPAPATPPAGGRGDTKAAPAGPTATEDGLRWDMISQVAVALKEKNGKAFTGFKVEQVYLTSQNADLETYINAIHSHANLQDGKPAYNGYLVRNPTAPAKIRNCAVAPVRGDARAIIKDVNVPIIAVAGQGDMLNALPYRRPDADGPNGRYRLYEIAGAAHIDKFAYSAAFPKFADQIAAVGSAQGSPDWPFTAMCEPPIALSEHPLLKYSYNAALMNLEAWVRKGTAPPKADRIQVTEGQTPTLVMDEFGHAKGGVRNPWVDVPAATYATTTPGPGTCAELGHVIPFSPERIRMLYKTPQEYGKKVSVEVDALVQARWFTESDGKKMKAELIAAFGK